MLRPLWRESRGIAIGAVLALGLSALALYRLVGTPAASTSLRRSRLRDRCRKPSPSCEAELERNPGQADGWQLLGKSYAMLDRQADARDAYARAVKLTPDDPDLLVEAAQARAVRRSAEAAGCRRSVAMLQHALELQPQHQRARWFLGICAAPGRPSRRGREDLGTAARAGRCDDRRHPARRRSTPRARMPACRRLPLPPRRSARRANANALTVKVALDPDFASRVRLRGDASVFVIARVPDGPPMPVAVEKHALQDLPLTVTLDDGDSPMPTQKLSALKEVELVARLSSSGQAIRQEGDLESAPVRVTLAGQGAGGTGDRRRQK